MFRKNTLGLFLRSPFCTATKSNIDVSRLTNFKPGSIPQSMKYDRPVKITKLPSGITVATQLLPSKLTTISVFIKCGSRNQTQQTSGTAHFLQHLHFKGTSRRSRQNLQLQVEQIGGNLNAYTSRQITCYSLTVFNTNEEQAVDVLGDMLTNSLYRAADVENERNTIFTELVETQKSGPMETTIEIAHKGAYRNHQMGLPILGSIGNMRTISRDMIADYHDKNYVGSNMIVVGCGPIDHQRLLDYVNKYIKVSKKDPVDSPQKLSNFSKPTFYPGIAAAESDTPGIVHVAALFEAPSFFDQDFFSFMLMQRIIGDQPQTQGETLALSHLPSERFQHLLTQYKSLSKQKGFYTSYFDTGLFGNYFECQPDRLEDAINVTNQSFKMYADTITQEEIMKAKRRAFIEILQHESQDDISQNLGNNLVYYDRRVCRREVAERISCVTKEDIQAAFGRLTSDKMQLMVFGDVKSAKYHGQSLTVDQ